MGYALESGVTDTTGHSLVSLNGGVDANNTTQEELGAGGVFTGVGSDTSHWASVIVTCHVDVASATDGLEIQWSPDNSVWFTSDVFTISANTCKIFTFMPVGKYVRLKYTNGATPQSAFYMCLQWRSTSVKPSSHRIQDSISTEDDAELVKSVLSGQSPDGSFDNVKLDHLGSLNVAFGDTANLDAFSRLRVSNPDTVFDSNFQYDLQPLVYQAVTANGGTVTHTAAKSAATLTLDGTAGGAAAIQSKSYHRYIPGKGHLVLITGGFGTAVAGVSKRAGYYDTNDGVYYEQNGTSGVQWVLRSSVSGSPVNTAVAQADWNIDTMDGSGGASNRSGITLDPTKVYILFIDIQWLGMGRVRVGFDIAGRFWPVHEFLTANVGTSVYMRTANLPIRWAISGDTAATADAVCCSVQSEGGADKFLSYQFAYDRAQMTAGNGTQTYAFSIRPKATFNSITNRMLIRPTEFGIYVAGSNPVLTEVYYGTTIGGSPSWSDMNTTYSGLQVDTAGTPSGGVKIMSFMAPGSAANKNAVVKTVSSRYPLTLDVAGTGYNIITVYVTAYTGTSLCNPSMAWEEIR